MFLVHWRIWFDRSTGETSYRKSEVYPEEMTTALETVGGFELDVGMLDKL